MIAFRPVFFASAMLLCANTHAASAQWIGSDLPQEEQAIVASSLDKLHAETPSPTRSPNDLGWDIQFGAEAVLHGDERFGAYLSTRIRQLIADGDPGDKGALLWGRGTSARTADTQSTFQSGVAITALAEASLALRQPQLLAIAKGSLGYWVDRAVRPSICTPCILFPSNNDPAQAPGFVRNMNVFLGLAAAAVETAQTQPPEIALAVVKEEQYERQVGNHGYLSSFDPRWQAKQAGEKNRIENHLAALSTSMLRIGQMTKSDAATSLAHESYVDWAECNNGKCRTQPCHYWAADASVCEVTATFAHCAFRKTDRNARDQCVQAIDKAGSLTSAELLYIVAGD